MIVPIAIVDDPRSFSRIIMADRSLCPKPFCHRNPMNKSTMNICCSAPARAGGYGDSYRCKYCRGISGGFCDCSMIKTPAEKSLINRSLIHRIQVRRGLVVSLSGIRREKP